jgi:hypothetical protein
MSITGDLLHRGGSDNSKPNVSRLARDNRPVELNPHAGETGYGKNALSAENSGSKNKY